MRSLKKCSDADAQLNKSAQMMMLLWIKCSDKNAHVEKYAQIKMLRNKCSAAKKCSDEMLRLAQDPPEHE